MVSRVMSGATTNRGNSDLKDIDGSEALVVNMDQQQQPTSPTEKENTHANRL